MDIFYSNSFLKSVRRLSERYKSIKKDLQIFVRSLEENPKQGRELSRGLYKVRLKNSDNNKGKSAGYRVITYSVTENEVLLVDIFSKSDMENITDDAIDIIVKRYTQYKEN